MTSISVALLDLKRLDQLACGTTFLHRLDARVKVLATLVFVVCVASFDRYQISALIPFLLFPALLISAGELPARYILGKVVLVAPFAIAVGLCNPFFDRQLLLQLGTFQVTGGWLSFTSIVLRTGLTVGAVFTMTALTGFPAVCRALQRLGMPRPFALQLMFLYRYLFVLAEEAGRAAKARELRCLGRKGAGLKSYASLLGHLLLRTWQRAERMHMAMLARGFSGTFPEPAKARLRIFDVVFLSLWVTLCIAFRLANVTQWVGTFFTGLLP